MQEAVFQSEISSWWVCLPEFIISAQKVALQMPSVCISITSTVCVAKGHSVKMCIFIMYGEVAYILMAFGYIQIWHHSLPTYIKRTKIVLQTTPCPSQSKSVQCSMKLQSIQCCHRVANLILIIQEIVQKPHTLVINNSLLVTTPNIYSVWCTRARFLFSSIFLRRRYWLQEHAACS